MANKKEIIIIFLVTVILVGMLAAWTAYKNGELPLLGAETLENVEIPRAPTAEVSEENTDDFSNALIDVASMKTTQVTLGTNKGDIVLELFTEAMPITVENFLTLAQDGFYNDTKFHRVISGFMVQGGDPNSKGNDTSLYGQGGPGYSIEDEFVSGDLLTNTRGTIAMANTGQPNSGGSQFFINLVDNSFLDFDKQPLSSKHPVFGRVVEGMEIVDEIAALPTAPGDVPLEPVVITTVTVAE